MILFICMYNRLLELATLGDLDVVMCNGIYIYTDGSPYQFSR